MPTSPDSITFQLYRANLDATTVKEMEGTRLAELELSSGEVSGTDTVADVKRIVLPRLAQHLRADDSVTLVVSRNEMADDSLFYADNYLLLPAWIQIVLHPGTWADVQAAFARVAARR